MPRVATSLGTLTLLAVAATACGGGRASGGPDEGAEPAAAPLTSYTGTFSAPNLPITGTIRLTPRDARRFDVRVELRYAPFNAELPWDVVQGACGDDGSRPLMLASANRPVPTRSDGTGELRTTTELRFAAGARYYVRLYPSRQAASLQQPLACANLAEM